MVVSAGNGEEGAPLSRRNTINIKEKDNNSGNECYIVECTTNRFFSESSLASLYSA